MINACDIVDVEQVARSQPTDFTKLEHTSAVLSVDACHNLQIFATCSR